jgi:glutamyl/glutaminyl-tRNA synthetase
LSPPSTSYRGRLAPSPTGYLHLGHARTFWIAQTRARAAGGTLVFRNDDLDRSRVRPEFVEAMIEDLRWLGFDWQEGPDLGGPFTPYNQSERLEFYRSLLEQLKAGELVYPCTCSRQDVLRAVQAPHAGDKEPIYPGTCRNNLVKDASGPRVNWRLRVALNGIVQFEDGHFGTRRFTGGIDFGDFVVWRHDDLPAYQLACAGDDAAMKISEVVRGADLLISTARQILLYQSMDLAIPLFFHCPLMTDEHGVRLAKRHDSLSLRELRRRGAKPDKITAEFSVLPSEREALT